MRRTEEKKVFIFFINHVLFISFSILYYCCLFSGQFLILNLCFFFPDMITLAMGNQAERFIPAFLFLVANDQKKVLGSARALTISHFLVDVFFSCTLRYPCFRTQLFKFKHETCRSSPYAFDLHIFPSSSIKQELYVNCFLVDSILHLQNCLLIKDLLGIMCSFSNGQCCLLVIYGIALNICHLSFETAN